jgi:hypothetical protein
MLTATDHDPTILKRAPEDPDIPKLKSAGLLERASLGNHCQLPAAFSGLACTCESRLRLSRRKHSQPARFTWPGRTPSLALRSRRDQGGHPEDVGLIP